MTLDTGHAIFVHSPSFPALQQSAASTQCILCCMLAHEFKHTALPFGGRDDAEFWCPDESLPVVMTARGVHDNVRVACAEKLSFYLLPCTMPENFRRFSSQVPDLLDTTTGSKKSLELVREWLQLCIKDHAECTNFCGSQPAVLPTRVIDVGPPNTNKNPVLVISDGRTASYVALSHSWGPSTAGILRTTSANFQQHQSSIALDALPQNFRDAIAITKAVACRFLWIDSLCIIQDSSDDWVRESGRMQRVYRNALMTISATRSPDAHGGCFATREGSLYRPVALAMSGRGVQEGVSFWSPYKYPTPTGPLFTRAWVLQEQLLSGRTVAFCDETIFWSCVCGRYSESRPYETPGRRSDSDTQAFQKLVLSFEEQPVAKRTRQAGRRKRQLYDTWYDIVRDYSRRDLTYSTDKFVAVSSVAQQMGSILEDSYVAGLWRKDFIRGLLWTPSESESAQPRRRVRPPRIFIAPSWSWASFEGRLGSAAAEALNEGVVRMDGAVTLPGGGTVGAEEWDELPVGDAEGVEVLEVSCGAEEGNLFGAVTDGTVRMRGYVRMTTYEYPETLLDPTTGTTIGSVNLDEPLAPEDDGATIWCLFIARFVSSHADPIPGVDHGITMTHRPSGGTYLALMLTGLRDNEYRRVGRAGIEDDGWNKVGRREILLV